MLRAVSAYTSLEALLHDAFWADEGEPVELAMLDELLRGQPGLSLEIGCGSGRLLLPLLVVGCLLLLRLVNLHGVVL